MQTDTEKRTTGLEDGLYMALIQLVAEIRMRDGEGNVLPERLPSMRDARMAIDVYRRRRDGHA